MRRIAAQYIFPVTGAPIPRGVITLNDRNVITAIGTLQDETESTEFYNGIITAGFVNAHCHLELSHLREVLTPGGGLADFIRQISGPSRYITHSDTRHQAMVNADKEMRQNGIVAVADICNTGESFAVKHTSPLFYHSFIEVAGLDETAAATKLHTARQLLALVEQLGLSASITPHAAYSMGDTLFEESLREAHRAGRLSVHNQESEAENELFLTGTGALQRLFANSGLTPPRPIRRTAIHCWLPVVAPGTTALFVHNVATSEDDCLAATARLPRLTWVLCPNSNLQLGEKLPPVDMFFRHNAPVAIGTDSLASNQRLSVLEELKTISQSFPQVPLATLLQWATLNGAKALQKDAELGSLRPGTKPGIVLIEKLDMASLRLTPDSTARRLDI
jgi:cytosine/adenosine deaminase-related metal-dependent hydrolase